MVFSSLSTLVTLANIPNDKPPFGKLLQEHIQELRKQLDKEELKPNENANETINENTQTSLRPSSYIPGSAKDVRALFDAVNSHIPKDNTCDKTYGNPQQQVPRQIDGEAQRVHALLDSLSDSVANMNTSSRVYRPFVSPRLGSDIEHVVGVDYSSTGGRALPRQLPKPPGPPSAWENSSLPAPAPPGSFVQPRRFL